MVNNWPSVGFCITNHNAMSPSVQPIPHSVSSPCVQALFLQCASRDNARMDVHLKSLAKVKVGKEKTLFFPSPLNHSFHHRKQSDWSGKICLW